jgi:hypothetical protein
MNNLSEQLGRSMTTKEVAEFLSLDMVTVRKYYLQLGGVRFGTAYRFFERRIIDAIQKPQQQMDWSNSLSQPDQKENIQNEKGGNRLGKKHGKGIAISQERDPFGPTY